MAEPGLAAYIDHTLLKPDATAPEVERCVAEALEHGFAGVCVNTARIEQVARALAGSTCLPVAVVGFPLGASLSTVKAFEAREAVRLGAREVDMVLNVGALKDGDHSSVEQDIRAVVDAVHPIPVKVILETHLLTQDEKVSACELSRSAGAAFVKTSTGFSGGGATVEDVALMRKVVGPKLGVKASGGVRTAEDAQRMLAAGANRLGASSSVAIVTGQKGPTGY